jgi:hypothetical protein
MSGYKPNSTSSNDDADDHHTDTAEEFAPSSHQLQRTAELVAAGDLPLPQHLTDEQLAMLVREVRQRRRQRLVQYVARAIAQDILRSRGQ